jgi:hypothetical protein
MRANGTAPVQEQKVRVMLCHNVPSRIGLHHHEGEHNMEVVSEADDIGRLPLIDELRGRHPYGPERWPLGRPDAIRTIKNVSPDVKVLIRAYHAQRVLPGRCAGRTATSRATPVPASGERHPHRQPRPEPPDLSTVTQLVTTFVAGSGRADRPTSSTTA